MMLQRTIRFGLATALLLALGCGQGDTPPTAKVTGSVTYNGDPVEGAAVGFIPESGRPASGTTDAAGKFTLSTFETGDGAVLGKHSVTITETSEVPSGEEDYSLPDQSAARFPARYADPSTSGFTAIVEAGKENHFTFPMTD